MLLNPLLLEVLRCPACKGNLSSRPDRLVCSPCERIYPIVLGIPDLRVYEDPLVPLQDDYRKAEKLQAEAEKLSFAELVRFYWSLPTYPPTPPELRERFIRHVVTDEQRTEGYREKLGRGGSFLEVGCGTAALVKAAQQSFTFAVGSDIAFRWLIVARKRLIEAGLPPNLVCCCADHLPFSDGFFDTTASVSLLEHLPQASAAIDEQARVTKDGGRVVVWTTNRFSIAAEPHVRVWGVGFLPRRFMARYVKWRVGLAYDRKHLFSCFELRRILKAAGLDPVRFSLPVVTEADWENLRGLELWGARIYMGLGRFAPFRWPLIVLSPAILAVAYRSRTKRGAGGVSS